MRLALVAAALSLWAGIAQGLDCRDSRFEGASFTTCEVGPDEDLRLVWGDSAGQAYGGFSRLEAALTKAGLHLAMAMNAGMFAEDLSPIGLYIEDGQRRTPLVTRDGPGNFGLLPNGVFCIADRPRYAVIETRAFAAAPPDCRHATQSGPMLVIGGQLHPRFLANSDSVHYRNGVGVSKDGSKAYLVISNDRVNFHLFARFFRDSLGLRDALYLDGSVSRLHVAALSRSDFGFSIGPMLAVVAPGGG